MKKSTKGAVAASAAALLLLGGMGTQAGWTDQAADGGGTLASGYLRLDATCDGWLLDGVSVTDLSSVRLVPGNSLTQVCRFTVAMRGNTLTAELDVDGPQLAGDLNVHVTVSSDFENAEPAAVGSAGDDDIPF